MRGIQLANQVHHGAIEPFALVIFGASGDLAHRKLLPAVYDLFRDNLWPEKAFVVGFARTEMSDDAFRDSVRQAFQAHPPNHAVEEATWQDFAQKLFYQQGSYDTADDFSKLRQRLEEMARQRGIPANFMFYLSTPPEQFTPIVQNLGMAGLARPGQTQSPWSKIVIEKPYGRDLDTSRELDREILSCFREGQVYRIDHYLGKETVQNLLVLRFANSVFEPVWNQKYVDHVQITVSETLGVGKRGSYYDQSGAIRDMVQNHMMNLLCLAAMEPPVSLDSDAVRNEKVKLLRALRPIPSDCVGYGVVRAQYGRGEIGDEKTPAYLEEKGVAADSRTETYAAFRANIDNWRWSGVPFYLRTGKRLAETMSEVSIHFKNVPPVLFNTGPYGPMQPNILVIRIQPDEGISMQFQVKEPGAAMHIRPFQMNFGYVDAFKAAPPNAYERLLLDAAAGDSTLFLRNDEIEAAWTFVMPILQGCDLAAGQHLPTYPAGSWGPKEADELIGRDGNRWHVAKRNGRNG